MSLEFLTSKSVVNVGAAALAVMVAVNGIQQLADAHGIGQLAVRHGHSTALALSSLIALVTFNDKALKVPRRFLLYVANAILIFSVAVGINNATYDAATADVRAGSTQVETQCDCQPGRVIEEFGPGEGVPRPLRWLIRDWSW